MTPPHLCICTARLLYFQVYSWSLSQWNRWKRARQERGSGVGVSLWGGGPLELTCSPSSNLLTLGSNCGTGSFISLQPAGRTAHSDTDKHGPVECKVRLEENRRPQTQEIHNENSKKKKNQKASFSFQMTKKCNKRVLKTPRPSTKGGSKWNQKGFNQQLTRPKKKKTHP